MEDFLKDRPVLDPKSALVLAAEPKPVVSAIKPPSAPAAMGASPFGDLRRDATAPAAPAAKPAAARPAGGSPTSASAAEVQLSAQPQSLKGEHGTKVQTIVERGRVVKIVVTCTCGKVTEIACQY